MNIATLASVQKLFSQDSEGGGALNKHSLANLLLLHRVIVSQQYDRYGVGVGVGVLKVKLNNGI